MKTFKKFINRYGWRCFTWRLLIFPLALVGYAISAIGKMVAWLSFILVGDFDHARQIYQAKSDLLE
ncbi:MAG: hypothetical protein LBL90_03665 [Prevotellaceae bacterium]|nr:hypothetical protein [Prevotellaceae bacterium]